MNEDLLFQNFKEYLNSIYLLPETTWPAIKEQLSFRHFKKETVYSRKGETLKNLQFVMSGLIRAYFIKAGDEITWSFFDDGEIAVDFPSFIKGEPSKLNYEAISDSTCISISKVNLECLYKKYPKTNYIGRVLTERGFIKHHHRSRSLLLDTPEQRYLSLISDKPHIIQNVPQRFIASFIGVKPESLSRIKKRITRTVS